MAQSQSQAPVKKARVKGSAPKAGEKFRCEKCGMEMTVTKECPCPDDSRMTLECCDQSMMRF
jgi:hypothetical protein